MSSIKILHIIKGMAAGFVGVLLGIFIFFSVGQLIFKDFYKPFIVLSGSMEPAVSVGSVVFARRAPNYDIGDVISFSPTGGKTDIVTHRVTSNEKELYETKGDANDDPDTWLLPKDRIVGRVEFSLPYLGYLVDWAKTPQGFILLVIIPATIIVYEELKSIRDELARTIKKLSVARAPKRNLSLLAVILPLIGVIFVLTFSVSKAYFMDSEQNTTNVLGAANVFPTPTPELTPSPEPTITP